MYYGLSYEEFQEKTDREIYRIDEYKKKCILTDKHIEALQYSKASVPSKSLQWSYCSRTGHEEPSKARLWCTRRER